MKDLIEREDAIKAVSEPFDRKYWQYTTRSIRDTVKALKDIPPVEPRRLEITAAEMEKLLALGWTIHTRPKQGEWLFVGSSIEAEWECSECGEKEFGSKSSLTNFCPNCGADMRKGAGDENNQRMD